MTNEQEFYRRSIEHPVEFWKEQAELVSWAKPFDQVLDYSNPPFARWFPGGEINLCYNAVDRHLPERSEQAALVYISSETGCEKAYTYAELHAEVQQTAAMFRALGVEKGDRVLIYMPMIPEAVFAMLACVRLGAIHSVVFGGFAAHSLATRMDDAKPKVLISADAGMRNGKPVPYKSLLVEALRTAKHPPQHVVIVNRGIDPTRKPGDESFLDYGKVREQCRDTVVPCTFIESCEPSYLLYTSGTTGEPKGVQRDTGGYTVALAASMRHIYDSRPGEAFFTTSDIGWVVGHSYIVYAPLINGGTTILYEGLPTRPDPGIWWKIVHDYNVTVMFTSPTAVRVLKKYDPAYLTRYDLSCLKHVFVAGEPMDEPSARWLAEGLNKPVYDHYWQTETGWAILTALAGVSNPVTKFGSPSFPAYGYSVRLMDERTGVEAGANEKGMVCVVPPLPPGCFSTLWQKDQQFVNNYFTRFLPEMLYSTFDWGVRDADGYYFILGRTDDVINVAGHRLGTREIEQAICSHPAIAEAAVVGVADPLKGQVPLAFAVVRDASAYVKPEDIQRLEKELLEEVDTLLGAIARPAGVHIVSQLPKTRSGKVLRRSIQAIAEHRETGDLSTLDDPFGIDQIKNAVNAKQAASA